jgi:hypothetical protein
VAGLGLAFAVRAVASGDDAVGLASAGACVVAPLYAQLALSCQPHRRPLRSYTLVEGVGVPLQAGALSQVTSEPAVVLVVVFRGRLVGVGGGPPGERTGVSRTPSEGVMEGSVPLLVVGTEDGLGAAMVVGAH